MDCHLFRKSHLAYLDDTLPGDLMAAAQRHVLACNGCAAHDTLVRRSLMVARSLPTLEPSADFQERLRARLAECRSEGQGPGARRFTAAGRDDDALFAPRAAVRPTRAVLAMAASAVLGVMAWQAFAEAGPPELVMQPVIATRPAPAAVTTPYLTPAMVQALSTGNPVWPAAMLIEDAPATFVNTAYSFAEMR
jgi:hypothetical protein